MKFSYTALSPTNQKLSGVLEAESLDAAKEELHKMGLSIISVNEISEEEYARKSQEEKSKKRQPAFKPIILKPSIQGAKR